MALRKVCFLVSFVAILRIPVKGGEAGSDVAVDARLGKAVTLDDYHPWTPITDREAWSARAERVREQILVASGLWPMPPAAPLKAVIHGKVDRGEYTVEKVFLQSWPGFYITGNLYRPKAPSANPRPGVLCPHGHWQNGRLYERGEAEAKRELESGAEKTMAGARYPLQARCAMLARMGCVVFMYDMVGVADSKQIGHATGFADVDGELRLQSAFGLQTYDSIRALDFLSGLDGVDPKRIGVTGASGGGTQTFILCGIDDRPAVAFPAVMVSTAMQGGCVCENATLLRVGTGNIEIAALTAPRPLGMTGAHDWTIDIETKGLPELKKLYAALGVPDLVDAKCFPHFEHNYNQVSRERMYAWMNRHLKLGFAEPGSDSIAEKPFEPIPPKSLTVFDAEHSLPGDAVDLASLRKEMSEISDRQMADLTSAMKDAAGLAAYRKVVAPALRAIVSSEVPAGSALSAKNLATSSVRAQGRPCKSERLVLSRAGTGEAVPATWIAPEPWNGSVVIAVSGLGRRGVAEVDSAGNVSGIATPILARGAAVLAVDVFLTGDLAPGGKSEFAKDAPRHAGYCGYTFGYNRTPLANRVHDVLTAVGHARSREGAREVRLVGLDEGGLWVLLAKALAGDGVGRAIADRPTFDFADVKDVNDLRLLPGGVKYGGWGGLAALCAPGELCLRGDEPLPAVLAAAYRAAGAEAKLQSIARTSDSEKLVSVLLAAP
jgi:dienelactone hydrolase